jgi:hypothetical protein
MSKENFDLDYFKNHYDDINQYNLTSPKIYNIYLLNNNIKLSMNEYYQKMKELFNLEINDKLIKYFIKIKKDIITFKIKLSDLIKYDIINVSKQQITDKFINNTDYIINNYDDYVLSQMTFDILLLNDNLRSNNYEQYMLFIKYYEYYKIYKKDYNNSLFNYKAYNTFNIRAPFIIKKRTHIECYQFI